MLAMSSGVMAMAQASVSKGGGTKGMVPPRQKAASQRLGIS
jgi:hypothetical protein